MKKKERNTPYVTRKLLIEAARMGPRWDYPNQISERIEEVPDHKYLVHDVIKFDGTDFVTCVISLKPFRETVVYCDVPLSFYFRRLPWMHTRYGHTTILFSPAKTEHRDNMNANNVTFEIDSENDDILIHSLLEGKPQVNRLRILHTWVLLYCLDPERFKDGCPTMTFCEEVMASEPPLGLVWSQGMVLVCLPDGWFHLAEASVKDVADALERKLYEYTESIGVEQPGEFILS